MKEKEIINQFTSFIESKTFPCVAAKAAFTKKQLKVIVAEHMACPKDDRSILEAIYNFIKDYRQSEKLFHSIAVIFPYTEIENEIMYDQLFWKRLQALADLDAEKFEYDYRVDSEPDSENFSFSLGNEAFFVIGLHPKSSRKARQFKYPAIVFNPHAQFEQLRENKQYVKMKNIVRKKDIAYSGDINPMLEDFGESSEVYQYTGRQYSESWKCPFHSNHNQTHHEHNQSA
ncbi:hypothetical protein GCM10007424_13420 [Flavobacterium suaedae]|uniref:YqcI/YcgG family protein n=1 Tax=Flavobacterium suaedae TaxID=1767027 RepID=A0ABQ1JU88_9FLAO|nr:guanitoxin biosynthesis heme-dependent pre-guanitoxin N-hydroxylase GntA [Flavobacterium suaedae]GGB74776.1 hypothetical protein GCM10007424_13420 [Flavobacterium suaedae]